MKYLWVICCLISLAACTKNDSFAMQNNTEDDTSAVMAVVRQLAQLMIARDTVAMNKILDKNYTLTHMTGYVQPKAAYLISMVYSQSCI